MIDESYGACNKCSEETVLGEGLCVDCWDIREDGALVSKRKSREEELYIDQLLGFHEEKEKVAERPFITKKGTPELQQSISKLLSSLSDRQRRVVVLRFGLENQRMYTLQGIGLEFNVTRERIRQIEAKALRRLRWQCYFGSSRQLKTYKDKEPTTLEEMLLRAIFRVSWKKRGQPLNDR